MLVMSTTAIKAAAAAVLGQAALARILDVKPPTVNQWANGERRIPDDKCPPTERATEGKVTCEELRPDLKWVRVQDAGWPHPCGRPLLDFAQTPIAEPALAKEGA